MNDWQKYNMDFLAGKRLRRLRQSGWIRDIVRQNILLSSDLILPIFLIEGKNKRSKIKTMPGVERLSIDLAVKKAKEAADLGIKALALFPHASKASRDENASEALNPNSLICQAVKEIKQNVPQIGLISDVALDVYTSHGQDGLVKDGVILNDETVEILVQSALIQAKAGADIIAPSDMMDGRVGALRIELDKAGFEHIPILSYAAKYASCFYGPFREAVGSLSRLKGDKLSYQLDYANSDEAMAEIEQDINEGADMVMVKPGLAYLDIIKRCKNEFNIPLFAYQVSGEYAMIEFAAKNGAFDRAQAIIESLYAFKRAGCDGILTYFAIDAAKILNNQ